MTMERETVQEENPGQVEMNTQVEQAEPEEGHEEIFSQGEQSASESALERTTEKTSLSESEVRALSGELYRKAVFDRDENVRVIWNASGILSMSPGLHMTIEGRDYRVLDIIHNKHLVMACSLQKE
jgi:hypothetical protein